MKIHQCALILAASTLSFVGLGKAFDSQCDKSCMLESLTDNKQEIARAFDGRIVEENGSSFKIKTDDETIISVNLDDDVEITVDEADEAGDKDED